MPSERFQELIELLDAQESDPLAMDYQELIRELSIEKLKEAGEIMPPAWRRLGSE